MEKDRSIDMQHLTCGMQEDLGFITKGDANVASPLNFSYSATFDLHLVGTAPQVS